MCNGVASKDQILCIDAQRVAARQRQTDKKFSTGEVIGANMAVSTKGMRRKAGTEITRDGTTKIFSSHGQREE